MLDTFIRIADKVIERKNILKNRINNLTTEISKPTTYYQGEQFEDYVENKLFPESDYALIKRTDTYERNKKRFSESTNDPDLLFRCKKTNKEFTVEVKYRSRLNKNNELSWCKKYQLERYTEIDKKNIPVFVAVGLGGVSHNPERLFLFPVRHVKYINLYLSIAEKYEIPKKHLKDSYPSEKLWSLIK